MSVTGVFPFPSFLREYPSFLRRQKSKTLWGEISACAGTTG